MYVLVLDLTSIPFCVQDIAALVADKMNAVLTSLGGKMRVAKDPPCDSAQMFVDPNQISRKCISQSVIFVLGMTAPLLDRCVMRDDDDAFSDPSVFRLDIRPQPIQIPLMFLVMLIDGPLMYPLRILYVPFNFDAGGWPDM